MTSPWPDGPTSDASFRVAAAAGVQPTTWLRTWAARRPDRPLDLRVLDAPEALAHVVEGRAAAGFVRDIGADDVLHAIPLYTERTVVLVPADHLLADVEGSIPLATALGAGRRLLPADDPLAWPDPQPAQSAASEPAAVGEPISTESTAEAVALVAAGTGILITPLSLARLHHRRDVVAVEVVGAPETSVVLAWRIDLDDPDIEDLIGVVRGRTPNSTRGRASSSAGTSSEKKAGGSAADSASARRADGRRSSGSHRGRGRGTTSRRGGRR